MKMIRINSIVFLSLMLSLPYFSMSFSFTIHPGKQIDSISSHEISNKTIEIEFFENNYHYPLPPSGDSLQNFCKSNLPTIADINIKGNNVTWYDEFKEGNRLSINTPLENNTFYYATQNRNGIESNNRFVVFVELDSLSITVTKIQVTSCQSAEGMISVEASNGYLPYEFNWCDGQKGNTISNLSKGNYTVSVVDALNCTIEETININCVPGFLPR